MKAKITNVEKQGKLVKITFGNHFPVADAIYDEVEYKEFRTLVLGMIKLKKLKHLVGLEFEWKLREKKPFPVSIIPPNRPILVDYREPESIFSALLPLSIEDNLEFGDYSFKGIGDVEVVIERKEVGDLISSLTSGHLGEQSRKMQGDVKVLLIEGFLTCTSQLKVRTKYGVRNLSWNSVWNSLQTIQRETGILLDFAPNDGITPLRIKSLYSYYQKEEHKTIRGIMLPGSNIEAPIRALMTFEGYSEITARKVLEGFGTLRGFFNASIEERESVSGVGPIKSRIVNKILDSPLKEK